MTPRVVQARYVSGYVLWLEFSDGSKGEVDLRDEIWGPIFEPLRNPAYFSRVTVHPDLHTVVWENGADFSPEFLHDQLSATA